MNPTKPDHRRFSSGAPWEKKVGYSRAVRAGDLIVISGTVASDGAGGVIGRGDPYAQARCCIEKIVQALREAGADARHVVRTRIFVVRISDWEEIGRAHAEVFGGHPPATTMVEVKQLIQPDFLVEIEADAVVAD